MTSDVENNGQPCTDTPLAAARSAHCRSGFVSISPNFFSQSWQRLMRDSELRTIRLHDLRHTHATILLKAGVPVKVVSERLGHSSPAFTMTVYQHVLPGMQADAAAAFSAAVFGLT